MQDLSASGPKTPLTQETRRTLPSHNHCHHHQQQHRHQRHLLCTSSPSDPHEIKPISASTWYQQQVKPTNDKVPTMGKKATKKSRKAAAATLRESSSKTRSTPPATPVSANVYTGSSFQDQSTPTLTSGQGPQPGWSAANISMDSTAYSHEQPAQNFQVAPGFQQPFNMIIPQPNLFSGLQQHLPAQQQAPSINTGFSIPQSGLSDKGQQPSFNNFYFPRPFFPQYLMSTVNQQPQENSAVVPTNRAPHGQGKEPPKSAPGSPKSSRPPIAAPSAASGGVPDPTPAYLVRASFLPQRRAYPGPLLVVIDLNGTVLHRPNRRQSSRFLSRRHATEFVQYCVRTFWVVIWSSARPDNVQRMVTTLLPPDDLKQIVAVWGRDKFGLTPADYNSRTQCYKRLTTLWNDSVVKASYPQGGGGGSRPGLESICWNQGNTVLIDDSAEKARSEPHNAITLPEFTGDVDEEMDVLPSVHDYLNELCYQEDVSAYMRANPFKMA